MRHLTEKAIRYPLAVFAIGFCLATAGCGSILSSGKPARVYFMLEPTGQPSAGGMLAARRLDLEVTAVPGLDTDRVLALDPESRLSQYANAHWTDHLPEVLRSVLSRSLENSGVLAVSDAGGSEPWSIKLELRAFYGLLNAAGGTSSVKVQLDGTAACAGSTVALQADNQQSVSEDRLGVVVAAHQRALDEATGELIASLRERCSKPEH